MTKEKRKKKITKQCTQPMIFRQCYQEFVSICKKDKKLLKEIEIIGLLGSADVNEAVKTWSDLDIFLILKSDKFGNIKQSTLNALKEIAFRLSVKYPIKISLLTHTLDNLKNYVGFEYLTHYSWANVGYTKYNLKEKIKKILDKRDVPAEAKKRYCLFYLRDIRFNVLRHYVSYNPHNTNDCIKELGRIIIDKMFTATDLSLIFFDTWAKSKKEMIGLAENKLDKHLNTNLLGQAYHLRLKWDKIDKKELKKFLPMGVDYIVQLTTYIIKLYPKPTTIEFLNP